MLYEFLEIIRSHAKPLEPLPTGVAPCVRPLTGIKAVLFDVYGTLLISGSGDVGTANLDSRRDAFAEALKAVGIESSTSAAWGTDSILQAIRASHDRARASGNDFAEVDIVSIWQEVLEEAAADGRIETPSLDHRVMKRLALEYEMRTNPVWPMPGCGDVLTALRDAGVVLGIISNAQFFTRLLFPSLLGQSLAELGFDSALNFFSFEHLSAKPGTYLYHLACDALAARDILPGEVVYVGNDMRNDIAPAKAVGFHTALFAGDQRSLRLRDGDPAVDGIVADLILTSLHQLPSCVIAQQ